MSVSGLCQVCESDPAVDRCERCGALACGRHYDPDEGLCVECVAETGVGEGGGDGPDGGRQFDDDDVPGDYRL